MSITSAALDFYLPNVIVYICHPREVLYAASKLCCFSHTHTCQTVTGPASNPWPAFAVKRAWPASIREWETNVVVSVQMSRAKQGSIRQRVQKQSPLTRTSKNMEESRHISLECMYIIWKACASSAVVCVWLSEQRHSICPVCVFSYIKLHFKLSRLFLKF